MGQNTLSAEVRQELSKRYFDPSKEYSLIGDARRFFNAVAADLPNITYEQVKQYLESQPVYTTHRQPRRTVARNKMQVYRTAQLLCADIMINRLNVQCTMPF